MPALLALLLSLPLALADATPDAAVRAALDHHPQVVAAQARVDALTQAADVGGTWADPMLSIEYSNAPVDTWSLADHPMAGLQLRLSQAFPTSGAPRLAHAVADAQVVDAQARQAEVAVQLEAAVRRAWWRLALVRSLRAVAAEQVTATAVLRDAVQARYAVGGASQADVLRVTVLHDRLADGLGDLDRDAATLTAELTQATGLTAFDTPPTVAVLPLDGDVATWADTAAADRPAVQALAAQVAVAQAQGRLARARGLPDLTVWVGYRVRLATTPTDPGTDFVSVGISAPIPVAGARRGAGEAAAAAARADAVQADQQALLVQLRTDLDGAVASWRRAEARAATVDRSLLPAARQARDAVVADYRVGRATVDALVQAQLSVLDLERDAVRAAVDTHLAAVTVGALLGRSLARTEASP
ncbi:MAG: TolC family protein [Alphaproteobacteria bacterium]|nr:TolC family protein [Alphaproteobacteria bacterium]